MNILTKENLKKYEHHLKVSDLKEFIEKYDIPDDAHVVIQRVEDMYYEGVDISGFCGPQGTFPPGSKASGWDVYTKDRQREGIAQYTPAWSCVYYKDDPDILFIDLHY